MRMTKVAQPVGRTPVLALAAAAGGEGARSQQQRGEVAHEVAKDGVAGRLIASVRADEHGELRVRVHVREVIPIRREWAYSRADVG